MNVLDMCKEARKRDTRPNTLHRAWSPVAGIVRWELRLRHVGKVIFDSMDPETARRIGQMYIDAANEAERQNGEKR